jgi:hypothetical protein
MPECRIVKGSVVASICLEIGEVVEEQALFDLDVVSNQSDLNQRIRSYADTRNAANGKCAWKRLEFRDFLY